MGFEWDAAQAEELVVNRYYEFFIFFVILIIIGVIIMLPTLIALARDLSFAQIMIVFIATLFGFWVLGFLLSFILTKKQSRMKE